MRALDFTGQVFGRLTVLERIIIRQSSHFRCRCKCGAERVVRGQSLRNGHTQSCGCIRIGRPSPLRKPTDAAFNKLLDAYRRNARAKGHDFSLSRDEALRLFTSPCFYCGLPPSAVCTVRPSSTTGYSSSFTYSGIDRVDNDKGYTPENTVPCCWECNRRKGRSSREHFLGWVLKVAREQGWTPGGTANCVSYAQRVGRPIRFINPEDFHVEAERARASTTHRS